MGTITITTKGSTAAPVVFNPDGFNYGGLDQSVAKTAKAAAHKIVELHTTAAKSIIQVGRELTKVKTLLNHGQWLPWLDSECGLSERTAQRYMSVAERLGDNENLLSTIPARVQYALSAPSTPVGFVDSVMADLEQGNFLPHNIMAKIKEAKAIVKTISWDGSPVVAVEPIAEPLPATPTVKKTMKELVAEKVEELKKSPEHIALVKIIQKGKAADLELVERLKAIGLDAANDAVKAAFPGHRIMSLMGNEAPNA